MDQRDEPARASGRPVDPRLLRYARTSRVFFVVIAAIGLGQTVVVVAFAWLLTRAIVGAVDGMPAAELSGVLAALGGVVAARAGLLWLREALSARAAARVRSELRTALTTAVGRLGPGWLATRNSAQLAVTAGRGLDALDAYFGRYLPQLVLTAIATPVLIAVIWWSDWISGLTVLLTMPLIPLFMVLIGLATRAVQRAQWQTLRQLAARFADTVRGLSTLTVFGRQHRAATSIERVTETYRVETMRVLRVSFLSGFALEFLASISVAIVAVSIGFRLIDGSLGLAVGLFVLLLAPEAYLPLRQVGVQFHAAAEGVAATDDVFDVLDAARARPADASDRAAADVSPATQDAAPGGTVRATDLRVRRGDLLLEPVTFTAEPGTVTLLAGTSGSGKSSVFAALRGVADFEGELSVDGAPPRPASTWLAWAGQEPGLIAGTVAENVTLGSPADTVSSEHGRRLLRRAQELAGAGDIDPGLELGVRGSGLSGGQAQRIAVARALYRHLSGAASVIALDEPSAALDAETEAELWQSLRRLADDGATVLLISHRASAGVIADAMVTVRAAQEVTA
ncbi:thiol reductant ABC exporter subunit CydD [Microbacterium thalli]|uniref:Thiol reductant ABC exporter subunit CydD n=1 Tax=Microbacterium thalli TaxID=3027921 RepID=A0ABT5SFS5_9MICO|nr:thiol reductant ABC exporter subunit CydD [Microbacterium thalli]MDD7961663.1 thiol reductant ABC exporter subunit CydD [Microbacterium thalli]MDN8549045.1 thiol reductant ABC exporter subunit CydD [Microbacterium thalli]